MKKGFTLIELLAVIIILAIVALIATPIILNVIDDARVSAGKSEANMILSGINNYCASEDMKYQLDNSYTKICTKDMTKEDVPTMVNLGNAKVEKLAYNGTKLTELVIKSNTHTFTLCDSGTFAMDDEECNCEIGGNDDIVEQPVKGNLISTLLGQYQEGNTTGLEKDATNPNLYYYTGTNEEVSNNFLWYGGHQWRVLEFDTEAKTLTLITQQPLTTIHFASAAWDTQEAYESSYVNSWLNDYFWNSLDSSIQSNIKDSTFNIGIYSDVDEITIVKKVGLLDQDQYVRAGGKGAFLDVKDYFLLGNRYNSSNVRVVDHNGNIYQSLVTNAGGIHAVIKVSDIYVSDGDGTLTDSYKIENTATNTAELQVGEYISVRYNGSDNACGSDNICKFRVVSKDSDSIKVVLNGLLPDTSTYGSAATISTSHTIYTLLNKFAEGISDIYRYIGNKTFYIGDYPVNSTNYEDVKDEQLEANVGLPTIGEMFSGNDIDLSTSIDKTFVDVNMIENPTASNYYWTMNRYDNSSVRNGAYRGDLYSPSISSASGLRSVIYLKSGLTFTGGEGTAQSPYIL